MTGGEVLAVPRLRGTQHRITCRAHQAADVRIAVMCFVSTQGWSIHDHYTLPDPEGGELSVWHLRRHPCGIPYITA